MKVRDKRLPGKLLVAMNRANITGDCKRLEEVCDELNQKVLVQLSPWVKDKEEIKLTEDD